MDKSYLNQLKELVHKPKKSEPQLLNETATETKGDTDLVTEIIKFFVENPYPQDDKVHAFAQEMGMNEHEFEAKIYAILSDILTEGKSKDFNGKYDPEQMKMGRQVEFEHTTIPEVADKIARDHLAEIPDYYTRLAKMEKEAGIEESRQILGEGKMEIVPKNGIGPIKLGMTFKQVKAAAPACNKTFKKTKDSVHLTLDCDKLNIHVFFDKNGIANQIEAFEGSGVTYKNYDFFKRSYKDAVSFLKRFGSAEKVGIHLWSDDGETLDSVLIKK
jgi:hypothetical protein